MKKVKFDVKVFEEKRQVLVVGSVVENGIKVTQIGIAKCHENDEFDAKRGEKIAKHKLPMKLIDVDYTFDMGKIIFFFTADGRIDFRELVRDLAAVFRTRIELRQIGVRDEAKMVGGIGCCGRPLCCATFLGDFKPVSIRMAKSQGMSLNPTKISGICGRLMCCLRYENSLYTSGELKCASCQQKAEQQKPPAVGRKVITDEGTGTVLRVHMKDHTVKVQLENGHTINVSWSDVAEVEHD